MLSLAPYFDYKNDIQTLLVIVEHETTHKLLLEICKTLRGLSTLYLASRSKKTLSWTRTFLYTELQQRGEVNLPEIKLVPYSKSLDITFDTQLDALIFDPWIKYSILKPLTKLKPKYLVGQVWKDHIPCFDIWERFKNISQHIHIEKMENAHKINVLDWNRNIDHPIELSVIFPVYNVAKYLPQCLDTVTAWKAPYIEFLFVNDGSPDNSRDIILEYQARDSRIKLLDKSNGGCASARKYGLEHAAGRYIGFIDPDDFIEPDMFRKLLSAAMIGNFDMSYCGYNTYIENSKKINRIDDALGFPYVYGTTDPLAIRKLIIYLRVAIWRAIYKSEFLYANDINFNENFRRFDDLPFKIEVCAAAKSVIAVPEHLYYYRLERPGQDVSCNDQRLYVHFDIFNYLNEQLKKYNNQKLFDFLQLTKVQTHCFALQKIDKLYRAEYCKNAKQDFQTNHMDVIRTCLLIYKYFGRDNLKTYLKIMRS